MGKAQLFAGNLASLMVAVLGFLQWLSWSIAGVLIIVSSVVAVVPFGALMNRRVATASEETAVKPASSSGERPLESQRASVEKQALEPRLEKKPEKPKEAPARAAEKPALEKESAEEDRDGPEIIGVEDFITFDVDLELGEEVVARVVCDGFVNVYLMTEENVSSLDAGGEFWYDAGSERVRETTLRFRPEEDGGSWVLVVENADSREVSATVKVSVEKGSRAVPFLRTEGLGLPDAKLESKLQGKQ